MATSKTQPSTVRWVMHATAVGLLGIVVNLGLTIALFVKLFWEDGCWPMGCWIATVLWAFMQNHFETHLNAGPVLTFSGDIHDMQPNEGAFVIANHQGYADYYLIHALASRAPTEPHSQAPASSKTSEDGPIIRQSAPISKGFGMLGKCRYFAKKSLVWQVPVFGWSFWAIGMILISRNWTSDASLIKQAFYRIKKNEHPCWIVSYLEGTRLTSKKVLSSRAFSRQGGKPELTNVLFPRTKGFVATVQELRASHIKYVYDLTLCYGVPQRHRGDFSAEVSPISSEDENRNEKGTLSHYPTLSVKGAPSLSEVLSIGDLATAGYSFHVDLKRTPISSLPDAEDGLKQWVEDAWVRKDRFLQKWYDELSASNVGRKAMTP